MPQLEGKAVIIETILYTFHQSHKKTHSGVQGVPKNLFLKISTGFSGKKDEQSAKERGT